ncbi:hypothetical protein [Phaeobacter sp.]|nr:hypothetical protein [Phaeobacter sp.]
MKRYKTLKNMIFTAGQTIRHREEWLEKRRPPAKTHIQPKG